MAIFSFHVKLQINVRIKQLAEEVYENNNHHIFNSFFDLSEHFIM